MLDELQHSSLAQNATDLAHRSHRVRDAAKRPRRQRRIDRRVVQRNALAINPDELAMFSYLTKHVEGDVAFLEWGATSSAGDPASRLLRDIVFWDVPREKPRLILQ